MNQKKIEVFLKEYGDMYGSPVLNIQKLAGFLSTKGCVVAKIYTIRRYYETIKGITVCTKEHQTLGLKAGMKIAIIEEKK